MVAARARQGGGDLLALRASGLDVTYVQTARALRFDGQVLSLVDLVPATVWIAHATPCRVGHIATGTFLDLWWHPDGGLAAGSRAVLGLADPDAILADPVLRVRRPRISGSGIRYDVEVLEGVLPDRSGACVLLVGPP